MAHRVPIDEQQRAGKEAERAPAVRTPEPRVLALQRSAGNAAVARLLAAERPTVETVTPRVSVEAVIRRADAPEPREQAPAAAVGPDRDGEEGVEGVAPDPEAITAA